MESSSSPNYHHEPLNPLLSFSTVIHQNCRRLGSDLASRFEQSKRLAGNFASSFPPFLAATAAVSQKRIRPSYQPDSPLFASLNQGKHVFDVALSTDQVAKTLAGTRVYTVSNSDNEFVLVSDPNALKSIGLLCFRQEDAEAFLAQVRTRKRELKGHAKVVPITLDQVYMLKVEGIAFRFLPDPVQIKNALETNTSALKETSNRGSQVIYGVGLDGTFEGILRVLKSADTRSGFDGVPVFQSDLLTVKRKNKRFSPIFFRKEDIEAELLKVSRASRGPDLSQHIMVGSLEDVLRKMERSEKSSGWDDLIFIPPGKSHSQHLQEVANA